MWFGTADGLCRYDGNILQAFRYNPSRDQTVVNNFVRGKLLEDCFGNIWYSNVSGLYKWDVLSQKVIQELPFEVIQFGHTEFETVAIDSTGRIWMVNHHFAVFSYDISNRSLTHYPLPENFNFPSFALRFISDDGADHIWMRIGTDRDPYTVFDKVNKTYSTQLESEPPHALIFEKYKRILAYDNQLVYETSDGARNVIPKSLKGNAFPFYSFDGVRDRHNRLWLTARGQGLIYYDEKNKFFRQYAHDNSKIKSLPFDLTTCLYIDRTDNLWIGLDGAGVARLDLKQPQFNLFPLSEGDFPMLKDYFTKCFYEDKNEKIWFGTQTNGLCILNPVNQELINFEHEPGNNSSLPGNMVGDILEDRDGRMWIGSSGGISIFHESEGKFETIPIENLPRLYPLVNNLVYRIIQLRNGDFMAATLLGIITFGKNKNGTFSGKYYQNAQAMSSVSTDLIEMSDGSIYAAQPSVGLYRLQKENGEYETREVYLEGLDLRSIQADENDPDKLWIGSGIGLIHFDTRTKNFRVWDQKDGLANAYVYGCLQEDDGKIWISTNQGLSNIHLKTGVVKNYFFQDGLQSNEFNTQAFYKSEKGNFYFGGIRGFNWFKPGDKKSRPVKPRAAITCIEINDSIFQQTSDFLHFPKISVTHDRNDFNFLFAALDYSRPEANNISYTLEGWDAGWIHTKNRSARYSNLLPGNYLLKLKVSNPDGVQSDEISLAIEILAPFWQRTEFKTIAGFLLLCVIIFITYKISRQRALRKLRLLEKQIAINAERNRISADMHDEIGSGITHIALLSELIQTQKKNESELKKDIQNIAHSARHLVQTMSEIIWSLNPQNDTLENLLAYIREQANSHFESMEIDFQVCFPDKMPDIKLSNEQRRNIYLVTREALNNALKHSGSKRIELKVYFTNNSCIFSVVDCGKGMPATPPRLANNGLANMKKRMHDIGGTIDWISEQGGTTVRYSLAV
jgi:signal transduction histidine kinase/ligand-binding sensor domain-containing protein